MIWLIEPVDPLIARDGRPFAAVPGARAKSLPFPPPSVIAGGVRTKAGLGTDGAFDESSIPALKTLAVRGPLLVDVDKNNAFLAPAPADALPFDITLESDNPRNEGESGGPADALPFETTPEKNSALEVKLLAPRPLPVNAHVDNGLDGLLPVGPAVADERKPANNPPAFWTWSRFEQWLVAPSDMTVKAADLGLNGPLAEARTHVAIDPDTQTGIDGRLFATGGLEFWHPLTPNDQPYPTARARRLALAVAIDDPHGSGLQPGEGYRPLGGERRLMHWTSAGMSLPSMPEGLATHIAETGRCRVILLTPAHFKDGWRPRAMLEPLYDVSATLEAAVVGQPLVLSGWSLEKPRGPKPTRRFARAGSVFYLTLNGTTDARRRWAEAMWLRCVSDEPADCLSGFGLAVVGLHPADTKEDTHA